MTRGTEVFLCRFGIFGMVPRFIPDLPNPKHEEIWNQSWALGWLKASCWVSLKARELSQSQVLAHRGLLLIIRMHRLLRAPV